MKPERKKCLAARYILDILSRENEWRNHRFDESLVRNGRLHRALYSRAGEREIYGTAGIVQRVTGMKKMRNYSRWVALPISGNSAGTVVYATHAGCLLNAA